MIGNLHHCVTRDSSAGADQLQLLTHVGFLPPLVCDEHASICRAPSTSRSVALATANDGSDSGDRGGGARHDPTASAEDASSADHAHSSSPPVLLHVVGWSMGGMIATHLATLIQARHGVHPHSVLCSLTLASSSAGGWIPPDPNASFLSLALLPVPRNLPPWRGLLICLRTIVSMRAHTRIKRILELHHAPMFYQAVRFLILSIFCI